jgi:Cytochrome C1 family
VGVTHDELQAKAIAESYEVSDGPNDIGEMFDRPGKLSGTELCCVTELLCIAVGQHWRRSYVQQIA